MAFLLGRRRFLQCAATVPALLQTIPAAPDSARWALLSDTHIAADPNDTYRGFAARANLKRAVAAVKAQPFDAVVVNGDLARLEGKPEDYDRFGVFAGELSNHAPLAVTMGNHDARAAARKSLQNIAGESEAVAAKWVSTLDSGPLRFIFLDSLLATNIAPGQVGKAQTSWLADYLARNAEKPTAIFVHHNPDPNSDNALVDAERLLNVLRPVRHVKALIFGHTHEYRYATTEGLHLINLPAVGYNFSDDQPIGWVEAAFRATGATFTLRALGGEASADGKQTTVAFR